MTTTISPTELRRHLDELEALEAQQRARQQRQADEERQRAADRARAEQERELNEIDLSPHDAARNEALDEFHAAALKLAAKSMEREAAKDRAVEILRRHQESPRVQFGIVNVLDRRRIASQKKEEVTEICRIVAPLLKRIGGATDRETTTVIDNRRRGGNALLGPEKG